VAIPEPPLLVTGWLVRLRPIVMLPRVSVLVNGEGLRRMKR
jgi:hypothetical protein